MSYFTIDETNPDDLFNIPKGTTRVVIKRLNITKLPTRSVHGKLVSCLPKTLKYLRLHDNRLKEVSGLPNGLEELIISEDYLESLPDLPESIKELSVVSHRYQRMEHLPASIVTFGMGTERPRWYLHNPCGAHEHVEEIGRRVLRKMRVKSLVNRF